MTISEGKARHFEALADHGGVIAATALDQRGSLKKALASAKGVPKEQIPAEMLSEFKVAVTRALTPHASSILLDPEYGLDAAKARSSNAGLLLAYELSGYDNSRTGRLPDLIPNMSVRRIVALGADAVKVLLYYTPFEDAAVNEIKHSFIERIGGECAAYDVPFFLELLGYDVAGANEKGLEYARSKPEIVRTSIEEFTKPQYQVDAFKIEIPVDTTFMEGSIAYSGQKAYTREQALDAFRAAASATSKPFIYLSAGVSNARFIESLELAHEAEVPFSGVLCGRATWKDGIEIYAQRGVVALEEWLATEGVSNINAINRVVRSATPWRQRGQTQSAAPTA